MSKWRKKPVVVEAWRWDGDFDCKLPEWLHWTTGRSALPKKVGEVCRSRPTHLFLGALEDGWEKLYPGQWLIRTPDGDLHPVDDSYFTATYEPVEDET